MTPLHQKPKDRPFNPWRVCDNSNLLRHVLVSLDVDERRGGKQPKRRKPVEQRRYEQITAALVSDLSYNHLTAEPCSLHLSRSCAVLSRKYQRRYRPDFLTGKLLPKILDAMERTGLLHQEKGRRGPKPVFAAYMNQTRIGAGPVLVQLLQQYGVTLDQIAADYEGQEIVVLKGEKDDWFTDANLTDYADTSDTVKFRNEVRTINAWLRETPIFLASDNGGGCLFDLRERHLRRFFTRSSFKSGGRLFGGFWQQMSKRDRLCRLRIKGEEIVEKDYSAVVPRLLYGIAGQSIPSALLDDLYRVPGFEGSRAGVKKLFNALLFDLPNTRRQGFPSDCHTLFDRQELQRVGGKVQPVIEAIKEAHAPVADHFGTGVGHYLMFLESQILVAVLLELRQREAYALPIHDAVLTCQRDSRIVERVMLQTFERMSGKAGKVSTLTHRDIL